MAVETVTCPNCAGGTGGLDDICNPCWGRAAPFQLVERDCLRCNGTGVVSAWEGGWTECRNCWGCGKVEVQRGPKAHGEIPNSPDLGGIRSAVAGWKANRQSES